MKIFLTSIVAQTLVTLYILYRAWYAFPPNRKWRLPIIWLIVAEEVLFFYAYFSHQHMEARLLSFIQVVCGTWFIASLYLGGMLLLLDLLRVINYFFPFYPSVVKKNYQKVKWIATGVIVSLVVVFLLVGYNHYLHPKPTYRQIVINKQAGGGRTALRICFASDLHMGYVVDRKQVERYLDLINQQAPDLVIFGGDMIDYDLSYLNEQRIDTLLYKLKAPLGVFAVLGNHEYRFNVEKKVHWLQQAGLTVLRDSVVMPQLSFYLVGRDDKKNLERKSLAYLVEGLDRTKPILVANHQPGNLYESVRAGIDLEMMGHVHNGQIWPYNLFMKWYWDGYSYGYKQIAQSQFFISSGLGLSGPPFRVFTHSELVVFDILFTPSS